MSNYCRSVFQVHGPLENRGRTLQVAPTSVGGSAEMNSGQTQITFDSVTWVRPAQSDSFTLDTLAVQIDVDALTVSWSGGSIAAALVNNFGPKVRTEGFPAASKFSLSGNLTGNYSIGAQNGSFNIPVAVQAINAGRSMREVTRSGHSITGSIASFYSRVGIEIIKSGGGQVTIFDGTVSSMPFRLVFDKCFDKVDLAGTFE